MPYSFFEAITIADSGWRYQSPLTNSGNRRWVRLTHPQLPTGLVLDWDGTLAQQSSTNAPIPLPRVSVDMLLSEQWRITIVNVSRDGTVTTSEYQQISTMR